MQIVRVPLSIGEPPSTESLLIWSSLREIGPKPTSGQRNPACLHRLQIAPLVFGFQRHKECIGTNEKKKKGKINRLNPFRPLRSPLLWECAVISYCPVRRLCHLASWTWGVNAELGLCLPPELHVRNIMHQGRLTTPLGAEKGGASTQYMCYTGKQIFSSYALQITDWQAHFVSKRGERA